QAKRIYAAIAGFLCGTCAVACDDRDIRRYVLHCTATEARVRNSISARRAGIRRVEAGYEARPEACFDGGCDRACERPPLIESYEHPDSWHQHNRWADFLGSRPNVVVSCVACLTDSSVARFEKRPSGVTAPSMKWTLISQQSLGRVINH